jgi:hypothetical protein
MEFIEIESIEEFDYNGIVYDLAIEEDESYNINGILVHNSACTTSANVSIHYPMASLVNECSEITNEFINPPKIIADGGFRNYSDIIKALALGADYVMLGGVFNKCLESSSPNCVRNIDRDGKETYTQISLSQASEILSRGEEVYKYYRGMSTKEVQKFWKRDILRTGEGITKWNRVEYSLSGWVENFIDYLKSAMSYTDSRNLKEFIRNVNWVKITQNSFNRFKK